ncbi:hypothetical protein [Thorsellia kenyensis]|uniref:YD repeat-containing protein n=1 Tax=Thorsellia kenyensis TaxID=1549888 RepID=A0ABV6C846_9GAMM
MNTRYRYDSTSQMMTAYDSKIQSTRILSLERTAEKSIADVVEEGAATSSTTYYYREAEKAYLSEKEMQTLSP